MIDQQTAAFACNVGCNRRDIKGDTAGDDHSQRLVLDAARQAWIALPTYTARAPLRRSGLIGPVRLLTLTDR